MNTVFEIQIIAVIISIACALPGNFLVLRKMSMMSDSITHTILLGIVPAFFITQDLSSPFLIVGAAIMGVITVWVTETLAKTRLIAQDSAIGLVFPLLFSISVILISRYAGSVHLDTDSVLLGELAFAPFERMIISGMDLGAKAIYSSLILLLINVIFISLFFKELKLITFDYTLATVLGFSPILIHYLLMTLVSITTVGAFESVGSILVVSFMITPSATAYLITNNLKTMLFLSGILAGLSAILGYQLSTFLDVSIAGSMSVMGGIIFAVVLLSSPNRGVIGMFLRRKKLKKEFLKQALILHICTKESFNDLKSISNQLNWSIQKTQSLLFALEKENKIILKGNIASPTPLGRKESEGFLNNYL